MACTRESGTCEWCQAGGAHKPGWFLPGEAERAAALLGMTLPEFFSRYVSVDWVSADHRVPPEAVFGLSPAVRGVPAGAEFGASPLGRCVFYVGGRCRIHAAKPAECAARWCGDKQADGDGLHHATAMAWRTA